MENKTIETAIIKELTDLSQECFLNALISREVFEEKVKRILDLYSPYLSSDQTRKEVSGELPSHYVEVQEPFFSGKGNHSVNQLEEICNDYKELVHQLRIRNQSLSTRKELQDLNEEFKGSVYSKYCCEQPAGSYSDEYVNFLKNKIGSLPAQISKEEDKITRIEVIDGKGRSYSRKFKNPVQLSFQDENRTVKIFSHEIAQGKEEDRKEIEKRILVLVERLDKLKDVGLLEVFLNQNSNDILKLKNILFPPSPKGKEEQ